MVKLLILFMNTENFFSFFQKIIDKLCKTVYNKKMIPASFKAVAVQIGLSSRWELDEQRLFGDLRFGF